MNEIIKIANNGVDARDLWSKLGIKHKFSDWISILIRDYEFIEGVDFNYFYGKSTGGRPSKEYIISVTMAKEISMVTKTDIGKKVRRYFIKCEKILREKSITRLVGVETRKSLTDKVKDSGENDRMHGFAYSSYTKLAYKYAGVSDLFKKFKALKLKDKSFRDYLNNEQIQHVEMIEKMIDSLLTMDKQYGDIKGTLEQIIPGKKAIK